jgi:hypothetical protein
LVNIDWDEYKEFKLYSVRDDNFEILLDFLKSYYNLTNAYDLFETLIEDDIAQMMLKKRSIADAASLERFMRKF